MIYKETFEKREYVGFVACSDEDITNSMIQKCFELDDQFFNDEYIYDREIVKNWIDKEKRLCFVVLDLNKKSLVGYTFLFPISSQLANKYLSGEITYLDMKEDDVLQMEDGCAYNLLYASEAFYPGYGIGDLHKVINEMLMKAVASLAKSNNIAIKGILFDSVCNYDARVINMLSLDYVGKSKNNTDIYYSEFVPSKMFKDLYAADKVKYIYELDVIQKVLNNVK